tara:strand:- start:5727 stop:6428 length:702 start_codon:yes stop_codon:yes gene_type:complete
MQIILAGCEYSGTTTLGLELKKWATNQLGIAPEYHDHWKIPEISCYPTGLPSATLTDSDKDHILSLSPKLKEMIQRQSIIYHMPDKIDDSDFIYIGFHYEDTVYCDRFFSYGGEKEVQGGPRTNYSRQLEQKLLSGAPDIIVIHVTCNSETIKKRMESDPHPYQIIKPQDIDEVLSNFEYEFNKSLLSPLKLDTTNKSITQSTDELIKLVESALSENDKIRIKAHKLFEEINK